MVENQTLCVLISAYGTEKTQTNSLSKENLSTNKSPPPLCLAGRRAWGCPAGEKHRGDVIQGEKTQANDVDICAEVKNEAIKPLHKLPNASAATRRSSKWGINKGRSRQAEGG